VAVRDWVIDALNRNMPFDQFTVEQIAGDLLPVRNAVAEGGDGVSSQPHAQRRGRPHRRGIASTTASIAWTRRDRMAGTTLGCSPSDHKFDPFTQKDYYRLFAYFNSIAEAAVDRGGNAPPVMSLPTPEDERRSPN
jgi:hypothetical protein